MVTWVGNVSVYRVTMAGTNSIHHFSSSPCLLGVISIVCILPLNTDQQPSKMIRKSTQTRWVGRQCLITMAGTNAIHHFNPMTLIHDLGRPSNTKADKFSKKSSKRPLIPSPLYFWTTKYYGLLAKHLGLCSHNFKENLPM